MKKRKCPAFLGLLCVFAALPVFAQTDEPQPISELSGTDPFKIASGSSFTASGAHPKASSPDSPGGIAKQKIVRDLEEALGVIRKNYVAGRNVDNNALAKSSINTMLRTLDPHSGYFDQAEFLEMLEDQRSEYFGIGSTIVNFEKNGVLETFVISTYPDSPAAKAKLRFGDRIVAVNGVKVTGELSSGVRDKVRGKIGSVVRLTIEHADKSAPETVELRRTRVPHPSIADAYILRNGTGYIDMTYGFTQTTGDEMTAALKFLHERGMRSLILDLRGNPGGILNQAVKVAEKFLPAGKVIATQRGRFTQDERIWRSANKTPETIPLVVLVDKYSASASEIVAGALQDYDRALIVGDKTFGKGLVQSVLGLPFGSGLTLTTAKYFTPSGRSIQRDYSDGSLYDYFNHKNGISKSAPARTEKRTAANRKVFGGDGIAPDQIVHKPEMSSMQISLLDPIFYFSREVIAGRVTGLEKYGSGAGQTSVRQLGGVDLVQYFHEFLKKYPAWTVPAGALPKENEFIGLRIKYNLIMSESGPVASNHFLADQDRTVAKAVEFLPQALQLAQAARPKP